MTPAALKSWRHHLGLSQRAAATALGCSLAMVSLYERGRYPVPPTIAKAAGWVAEHGPETPYEGPAVPS